MTKNKYLCQAGNLDLRQIIINFPFVINRFQTVQSTSQDFYLIMNSE